MCSNTIPCLVRFIFSEQLTDVVIVLNTAGAVEAFTGTGQVSLDTNKW